MKWFFVSFPSIHKHDSSSTGSFHSRYFQIVKLRPMQMSHTCIYIFTYIYRHMCKYIHIHTHTAVAFVDFHWSVPSCNLLEVPLISARLTMWITINIVSNIKKSVNTQVPKGMSGRAMQNNRSICISSSMHIGEEKNKRLKKPQSPAPHPKEFGIMYCFAWGGFTLSLVSFWSCRLAFVGVLLFRFHLVHLLGAFLTVILFWLSQ